MLNHPLSYNHIREREREREREINLS